MPLIRDPFEPAPEDSLVLDSILDYPIEPGDPADDGDDSGAPPPVPPLARRLAQRLAEVTSRGQ